MGLVHAAFFVGVATVRGLDFVCFIPVNHQIIHRRPALLVSKIETTVAAKFQQLQDLFPDANVVSMVESDATVLLYDYTSISVKVNAGGWDDEQTCKRKQACFFNGCVWEMPQYFSAVHGSIEVAVAVSQSTLLLL